MLYAKIIDGIAVISLKSDYFQGSRAVVAWITGQFHPWTVHLRGEEIFCNDSHKEVQSMKKFGSVLVLSFVFSCFFAIMAMAGAWQKDHVGWWYRNDNGSFPVREWVWLDGNNDGISECYCFDNRGYLLTNTRTPDGYDVNADGAWIEKGIVQTRGQARQGSGFRQNWVFGVYQASGQEVSAQMEIGYYSSTGQIYVNVEGVETRHPDHHGQFNGVVARTVGDTYYAVGQEGDSLSFSYDGQSQIRIFNSVIKNSDSSAFFNGFDAIYNKTEDGFES